MRFTTADTLPSDALTRLWNRGYAGYLVPVDFSTERMRAHLETASIDLALSPVLLDGGEPVGFSLLGVRGGRCWVGGFGLAPEARGGGLSHRLLREQIGRARSAGLARLHLEVLTENEVARRVYAAGGLETTRRLVFLEGTLPGGGAGEDPSDELDAPRSGSPSTDDPQMIDVRHSVRGQGTPPPELGDTRGQGLGEGADTRDAAADVSPPDALGHLTDLHRAWPACWQREPESLRVGLTDAHRGLLVGSADDPASAAIWADGSDGRVRLVDAAARDGAAAEALLAALAARRPGAAVTLGNEPAESPLVGALRGTAGARETLAQWEMAISLA